MIVSQNPPEPARILALETSGSVGGIALARGPERLALRALHTERNHAVELPPAIDALVRQVGWQPEEIDEIHVSAGPGSFTGLRVGITAARTLAWAVGARIVRVPSFEALARNALAAAPRPAHVAVLLDAKRAQVYAAVFALRDGRCETITDACVIRPERLLAQAPRPLAVLGEGIPFHRQAVDNAGVEILPESLWPARAEHVHAVGLERAARKEYTPPRDLVPLYLRRPEAEEKWEQRHGQTGTSDPPLRT